MFKEIIEVQLHLASSNDTLEWNFTLNSASYNTARVLPQNENIHSHQTQLRFDSWWTIFKFIKPDIKVVQIYNWNVLIIRKFEISSARTGPLR